MLTIKRLGFDRIEEIIAFDKLCFPIDFWTENDWNDLLTDEKAIYYALIDDEKIVGDVFIYNWKGEKDYVKIMNLAVHKNYRKQGLARKLLNFVTAEMEKSDMRRFLGETRASNKTMQKAFEDCGYSLRCIVDNYYNNPDESAYKYALQI